MSCVKKWLQWYIWLRRIRGIASFIDIPKYFEQGEESLHGEPSNPTEITYNEASILVLILIMTADLSRLIF